MDTAAGPGQALPTSQELPGISGSGTHGRAQAGQGAQGNWEQQGGTGDTPLPAHLAAAPAMSSTASPQIPSCRYRRGQHRLPHRTLYIVSIAHSRREPAILISGLLHEAYPRLPSELKRQTQMPRSWLPTAFTWQVGAPGGQTPRA